MNQPPDNETPEGRVADPPVTVVAENKMRVAYKIIDTNVFITDPASAPYSFGPKSDDVENILVIPYEVFQELDVLKKDRRDTENSRERARNARLAISELSKLQREHGGKLFGEGVKISPNYTVRIDSDPELRKYAGEGKQFLGDDTDSLIIKIAANLKTKGTVEIVTDDNGVNVKGTSIGLEVFPWRKYNAVSSESEIYKGWRHLEADAEAILRLSRQGSSLSLANFDIKNPQPNEYFLLKDPKTGRTAEGKFKNGNLVSLDYYLSAVAKGPITARSTRQKFLMDALRDPNIDLVFALGPAGTGKTFVLLEAAIALTWPQGAYESAESGEHEWEEDASPASQKRKKRKKGFENTPRYQGGRGHAPKEHLAKSIKPPYSGIITVRPAVGTSDDENPGFLPGSLEQKLDPYFMPIHDNLERIAVLHHIETTDQVEILNAIEKASLYFMRGRTLHKKFVLVDESQNLTVQKAELIITRAGDGTKVVLNGDFDQKDRDTFSDNGLSFANQAHQYDPHAATVYFERDDVVRSRRVRDSLRYFAAEKARRG